MRFTATLALGAGGSTDVFIDLEPESTAADLSRSLGSTTGITPDGLWIDGLRVQPEVVLEESPLHEAAHLALRAEDALVAPGPSTQGWQLHVITGPAAGQVWDLPIGTHEVGRSAAFSIPDRRLSRRHLSISVTGQGARLHDLGSGNGTTVDGQPVEPGDAGAPVAPGQLVGAGDTLMAIAVATGSDAAVASAPGGIVEVTRPPRIRPGTKPAHIVMPTKPEKRKGRRFPLIAMLLPLGLGVVMAYIVHNPTFLLFSLMSPLMGLSNFMSDRGDAKRDFKEAGQSYGERLEQTLATISTALADETEARRRAVPDAARTHLIATLPSRQVWERRRFDDDALLLRIGSADRPSELKVTLERSSEPWEQRTVFSVPVTVPLRDVGVLGVAGDVEPARTLAAWLVAQLATFHAPRDLFITVLAPSKGADWEWVRWLPHVRLEDPDACPAHVATDTDTLTSRVAELSGLLKERRDLKKAHSGVDRTHFPAHVIVLDGARSLRSTIGVSRLLQEGPEVGIYALCLETEERLLPEECQAAVILDRELPSRCELHRQGEPPITDILAEHVAPAVAEQIARGLAPLRDVNPEEGETTLPDSARLLDVLRLEPPTVDAVRARWQIDGQTTTMVLGAGSDGTFALDLRRDGPHGLIAGTTGSGKSELLQTMIASLAVANRPDAMNFVLIDYKGGSAFKDCVRLPHTVGMVTDLDTHLVGRALTSLGAELKRREHMLADADVKDIEDYQDKSARTAGGLPVMPRLLLVIDEFASMARELPDFVTGLVNIAQRGRSLGIHLLLATQRPSGVVSQEIRANTNMRISLRVTDGADSTDVLDSQDAARISKAHPGRGFARLGAGALLPFQAGRVGGRRPGIKRTDVRPPFVAEVGWGQLGYPAPRVPSSGSAEEDVLTDLSMLVDVIGDSARLEGQDEQRSPWLPALPDQLLLSSLEQPDPEVGGVALAWGVEDLPAVQLQRTRTLDLARDGHLLIIGASRSGRSQLLRTLAASAASYPLSDVHVVAIDCGNGAMAPLIELPHCGAVVTRAQTERAVRLFNRLSAEVERRQHILSAGGYSDAAEQRRSTTGAERLPHIVCLIDRWEGFTSTLGEVDNGALTDTVLTLLREGASAGIHMVIAGDRSLASGRISSLTESKVVLRLADRSDATLIGLHPKLMPDHQPPGRAIAVDGGLEIQTALLASDDSGPAQAAALVELGRLARERVKPEDVRPFRVDILPTTFAADEAMKWEPVDAGPLFVPVGVGGDELHLVGVDLGARGPVMVVAGPAKSGRSSALAHMARSLSARGTAMLIVAPRPSPLRDLAGAPGVRGVVTDAGAGIEEWQPLLDAGADEPFVVIIDDGETVKDNPVTAQLLDLVKGGNLQHVLILGGHSDNLGSGLSGWQVEAKKARQGLLLSPQGMGDGELIGVRLSRSASGQPIVPGRGLAHVGGQPLVTVTVPS